MTDPATLASRLSRLAEPPFDAAALLANTAAFPNCTSLFLDTLPLTATLPAEQALHVESLAYGVLQAGVEHQHWLDGRLAGNSLDPGRVLLERDGQNLTITLDRAWAHNAIDRAMRDGLRETFDLAALDPDIKSVRLVGIGKAFCTGADLSEFGTTRDPAVAHAIRMATLPAHAIARAAHKLAVHVQGACVGAGLEMAAFAHHITASSNAWFQLPELAMGLIPGAGGCVSIPRRIGEKRTALLLLSGRRISAKTALDWGLIDAIVDR